MPAQTGTSEPVKTNTCISAHTRTNGSSVWRWMEQQAGQVKIDGG